jgi:hypothetical protein
MKPINQKKQINENNTHQIVELSLGDWLKENRVTNKEFIVKMGISDTYARQLAKGKVKPSLEMAIAIEDMTLKPVHPAEKCYSYVCIRSWFWKK